MKKVSAALAALTTVSAVVVVFAGTSTAAPAKQTATVPVQLSAACRRPTIGVLAPVTGPAASIGREQLNWAKYAVANFNRADENQGQRVRIIQGDTQLPKTSAAVAAANRVASNRAVLGVVGPAGSQEVLAVAPRMRRAGLAFVSGSATRTDLTNGKLRGFFRVVPNDSKQGPTIARYIAFVLKPTAVWVIDDQSDYSRPLAASITANLRANKLTVTRESVNQEETDFSALVSRIQSGGRVVVVLPWQIAANAQIFGQQLREQGKNATIFGSDGLFAPSDFKINGSYVASFAPDIRAIERSRKFVTGYFKMFGSKAPFGTFGPPTYVATQVLLNAISQSCTSGRADGKVSRAEVLKFTRQTLIRQSMLGNNISFTRNGDVRGASFYIFRVEGGQYKLVPTTPTKP